MLINQSNKLASQLSESVVQLRVFLQHHLHLLFGIQLSNQPVTWQLLQCILWSWSRQPPELQTECQNGKEM